jgi:hypothetical protein
MSVLVKKVDFTRVKGNNKTNLQKCNIRVQGKSESALISYLKNDTPTNKACDEIIIKNVVWG